MAAKENPGGWQAAPGQKRYLESNTVWCFRQLVKIALPYIAAIITSTRYSDRKSLFLDRLMVLAEGGGHDT
jgi:hypothetical protein